MKHSRRYEQVAEGRDPLHRVSVTDAVGIVKNNATAKFDETVEVAANLGVDPRHADQQVRGTVVLPHGTGKSVSVLVITQGDKVKDAEEAGADYVGADDMIEKLFSSLGPRPRSPRIAAMTSSWARAPAGPSSGTT